MTLVVLIAAWIAGLLIGLDMNVSPAALALFSLAALILTGLLRSKGLSAWPGLLVLALLLGLLRVEVSDGPRPLDSFDNLQPVTVLGRVVTDPEVSGPAVEFVISVDAVDRGGGREDGGARLQVFARPPRELVRTRVQPYFRYGDTLELVGRLETPPALGDFDYRKYLASQGIHFTMSFPEEVRLIDEDEGSAALAAVYGLRHELSRGIDRALPEPQASLAQALLLGLRGRLPQDVTEDFRSTGTSHLLAISGLHVGVLLATALGAGVWLMGRRRQLYLLLPLGAIWFYALVSGLSPSVERAAIMGSVYLVALALGRPRSILPALALAAGVMAGVEPQVLKQVSFQLSFTAVAGIALFTTFEPTLLGRFTGGFPTGGTGRWHPLVRALVLAVAVSAVATLATLPLVAFNFHRIPTLGIPATVLALPALPFVLMSSGLAAVVGLANTTAGQVIGWVAWVPLEYVIRLIDLISRVPGSNLSVPAFSGALVWAYYGAIAVLILAPGVRRLMVGPLQRLAAAWHRLASGEGVPVSRLRFPSGLYLVPLVGLSVLAAVLWFYVVTGSDGRLHVHFLDVGQGDSVLIVTPEGRQVLIDGGPGPTAGARGVGGKIPFWDRSLDMVVLTHPDEDHFRGLVQVLERYGVGVVLEGGAVSENPLYLEWQRALGEEDTHRASAVRGQTIDLGGATRLEVLNPQPRPIRGTSSDGNNNGVVLRLLHGGVSFLLTADIEAEAERRLLQEGLSVNSHVLKVPHHGSKSSTTPRFLAAVNPVAAVISVGADNSYGHPYPEVTERLRGMPGRDRTFLTSENGDIEFITDGKSLWVKTER